MTETSVEARRCARADPVFLLVGNVGFLDGGQDAAVVIDLQDAVTPGSAGPGDAEGQLGPLIAVRPHEPVERAAHHDVAGDDEYGVIGGQFPGEDRESPGGAGQPGLDPVAHRYPVPVRRQVGRDLLRVVCEVDEELLRARRRELLQEVAEQRPVEHREQRLGDVVGVRREPAARPGGEDHARESHSRPSGPGFASTGTRRCVGVAASGRYTWGTPPRMALTTMWLTAMCRSSTSP